MAPGSRLPTRDELALLFGTSPSTVQVAIRGLVAEGSVVTRKRAGAFVASEPPERSRFAPGHVRPRAASCARLVVLPRQADLGGGAGRHAASRLAHGGLGCWRSAAGGADRQRALAGILYFGVPEQIPAVADAGIPLALFRLPEQPSHGAVSIAIDNRALFAISVRCHLARSRTRIAVLETGDCWLLRPSRLIAVCSSWWLRCAALAAPANRRGSNASTRCNPLAVHQAALLLLDVPASARPRRA